MGTIRRNSAGHALPLGFSASRFGEMNEYFANYLRMLERSEWLRPDELAQFQGDRLANLLLHAYEHAPFYRERLAPLFDADGGVDLSRWTEVPILMRTDVVSHGEQMRVANCPIEYGSVKDINTSGSLGTPLRVAINGAVSLGTNAALARLSRWFGLDPSRALASIKIFPGDERARYPTGRKSKEWIMGYGGPSYGLDVATPVAQQLEWLARTRAPYLLTYPSNAYALAEVVSRDEGRALGIEAVFAFAETVPDGARELVAERFGASLIPYYATQEIGIIAIQCPAKTQYHLAAENVVVELLDDEGRDVPVGERGRVVVTGLQNYAMPFIRYVLGDVAIASDKPCPCGRSLPVIERVEGRIRNAFTFRDGTRIWPRGWLAREMRAFVPFRQYQLVQKDFESIEFRYVPDGSDREVDLSGLTAFAKRMMHHSVEISLVPMQVLPRGPSGKFEDFISLVAGKGTRMTGLPVGA
jgi:phenylacetate-CoA ligase